MTGEEYRAMRGRMARNAHPLSRVIAFRKDKPMKRTLTLICLSLILGAAVFAGGRQEKPAGDLPSVDQILDKYIKAIGGKAAVQKQTSRVAKGTFDIPAMGAGGPITLYSKAPNKSLRVIEIPGFGIIQQGYNGSVGWSQDPQGGLRELAGAELVQAKREADFYADIKLKELYSKMTVKGKEKVGNGEAYVVEAVPTEGSPETLYFDTQSGLIVRTDTVAETPQGKQAFQTYLENYKEVEGIKMPFLIRQNSSAISFTVTLEEVKFNVPIDDAKFNKPASQ
jgi:outer membrane lipoprotein-sorting protein